MKKINYWAGGNRGNLNQLNRYLFSIPQSYNGERLKDLVYQQVDPSVVCYGDYRAFAQYVLFLSEMVQLNGCLDSGLL